MIVIDVGNTRSKFARVAWTAECALPRCQQFVAVPHGEQPPWEELARWCEDDPEASAAIAGGRPETVAAIASAWCRRFGQEPLRVENHRDVPLNVAVDAPQRVGIDRLLNAVAVNRLRPAGQPAIVVDSGTATTVDLVDSAGVFRGGAILPGMQLSADALHHYTALLPRVSVAELAQVLDAEQFPDPVGRNTRDAIRSGVFWGQLGAVRELIRLFVDALCGPSPVPRGQFDQTGAERCSAAAAAHGGTAADDAGAGGGRPPLVVVTGGGGGLLARWIPGAHYERALALQGLALSARWLRERGAT